MAPPASPLPRFLALYSALYLAFGVQSPFLPALLAGHGLGAEAIGLVLASGTAARLLTGPAAGWVADRLRARRAVLTGCVAGAALVALAYLPARGLGPILIVGVLSAALLAPLGPLTDALALGASAAVSREVGRHGFDYGWVRGAGAAAFVLASILAGQAVALAGIETIIWLHATLLAATAACAVGVRQYPAPPSAAIFANHRRGDALVLLRSPLFRRLVLVAALIQGSHAMQDSFAVIRWNAAGIGPGMAGSLWAESVVGEVAIFFTLGRPILDRLGPGGASALAACAGVLRWGVMAHTAWVPAIALVQPLHGLTFALQHLACVRMLGEIVPPRLTATALTIYGTLGVGAATAVLTVGSGLLYARFGPYGFWFMAALCAVALPLTQGLLMPAPR
jgi:PPP family 3-phenylpropionic acid transporter